ncbi:hypothetical protein B0T18DRAFT_421002 [Schizothecium vesticola]|uniref:Uncharacterized protein n=1 Tax=Schizothecium vesticola TaxID=314040 RepID=A0AA40BPF3_9PEZI|nr:hypothetical protein B0T18DRAFT_421002 [Schizothecium vesticola]
MRFSRLRRYRRPDRITDKKRSSLPDLQPRGRETQIVHESYRRPRRAEENSSPQIHRSFLAEDWER